MVKITPFDTAEHLDDPQVIKHYLAEARKTGDERVIRRAEQNISRAIGNKGLEKLTAMLSSVLVMKARARRAAKKAKARVAKKPRVAKKAKVAKKARAPKAAPKRPQQLASAPSVSASRKSRVTATRH